MQFEVREKPKAPDSSPFYTSGATAPPGGRCDETHGRLLKGRWNRVLKGYLIIMVKHPLM